MGIIIVLFEQTFKCFFVTGKSGVGYLIGSLCGFTLVDNFRGYSVDGFINFGRSFCVGFFYGIIILE